MFSIFLFTGRGGTEKFENLSVEREAKPRQIHLCQKYFKEPHWRAKAKVNSFKKEKSVPVMALPACGTRCHVYNYHRHKNLFQLWHYLLVGLGVIILDTYFSKVPPEAIEKDKFYVQLVAKLLLSRTARPIIEKKLGSFCDNGHFHNFSRADDNVHLKNLPRCLVCKKTTHVFQQSNRLLTETQNEGDAMFEKAKVYLRWEPEILNRAFLLL